MPGKVYLKSFPVAHSFWFCEGELMHKVLSVKIQQFLGDGYPEKFERTLLVYVFWFM